MKKQTITKVILLFGGVCARMEDNSDFFKGIDINYKSGRKTFTASVNVVDNGDFILKYNGVAKTANKQDILDFIDSESIKYDEIQIIYKERGSNVIIDGSDRSVKTHRSEISSDVIASKNAGSIATGSREYIIKVGQADELLKEIGIMTNEGKIRNDMIRKYSQIDHYIELVKPMLDTLPTDRSVTVLDCACGKSYLSFVLNFYMRDILKLKCHFIGIDYNEGVIDASRKMAKNLSYNNMEFVCADINSYTPHEKIDMLISLHACDTATDMALGLGIRSNVANIVCVPCCHKEMLSQYKCELLDALLRHGVFKARLADTLTDSMRALYLEACGYDVTALEYISPLETPKNLMIKAVKRQSENKKAVGEYAKIKELLGVKLSIEAYSQKL